MKIDVFILRVSTSPNGPLHVFFCKHDCSFMVENIDL